jgi:glycosyltransferase involved in cell wall biosynthesis
LTCRVSVVIPTRGRPDLLERCLAAVAGQALSSGGFEIIVVNDTVPPDPQTDGRCANVPGVDLHGAVPVHSLYSGGRGPAAARNLGWQAAQGDIIAFTDDDCIPCPGWLEAGLAVLGDDVAGVSGRVLVPRGDPPTDYERNVARLEHAEFITANCFYRRDVLADVGGFDERFSLPWREDTDLFFTLLEHGACLRWAPNSVVVHPVRPAPFGVSLKEQRKSVFNALLYRKHPVLYRKRLSLPTRSYYVMAGALLGALTALLGGRRRLAACLAGLWLMLTVRFCVQRLRGASHTPRHVAEMAVTSILIPPLALVWRIWGALKFRVWFV